MKKLVTLQDFVQAAYQRDLQTGTCGLEEAGCLPLPESFDHVRYNPAQQNRLVTLCGIVNALHDEFESVEKTCRFSWEK